MPRSLTPAPAAPDSTGAAPTGPAPTDPTPAHASAPVGPTGPAIEVRGLVKRYGSRTAVAGVDLDVHRGEVLALLGPNGAGKTTTVEILEGYRSRDEGTVRVLGVDPAVATLDWRARIGIVLQSSASFEELTAAEVVHHFAGYHADPHDPDEVLDLVGLAESADQRTVRLSGGQQRRLDVALAILGRPELVFLDEPTTGFDPEARRHFWDLIRSLRDAGTTILLTTHYLDEAEALADRVAVIADGRIVAVDVPAHLGGRDGAPAVVTWQEGGTLRLLRTDRPTHAVVELARRLGGEVPDLCVARPTLEDVYLDLIGADR